MKTKVKANWPGHEEPRKEYRSLELLIRQNPFIGFQPPSCDWRYMIISRGIEVRGTAIRPTGRWTNPESQKTAVGNYYIFNTAVELYEWMKG